MIYLYKDKIIRIEWSIYRGTSRVLEDFSRALVKVFLIGPKEKYFVNATAEGGKLLIDVPQGLPEGAYSLETIYVKNWNDLLPTSETVTPSCAPVPYRITRPGMRPNDHETIHPNDFHGNGRSLMRSRLDYVFAITSVPSETDTVESGENVTLNMKSSVASYGYDGLSAYETAVLHGKFEGTEGEWLEWTHERIVSDVKDLLDKLKSRDTRFVVKTQSQRDNLKDLREGDEVYVIDDGIAYILETENGKRTWKPCDYGTVTSKYILSLIAGMPGFVADRAIADEFGKRIVDEYLTREAVRNYMNEVFNDLFINNPPTIMDGMITVDMLSDAVKQLIGFGPIVNFPDDEFLTTKGGRITPKDRNYDPNNYSGMGRKILRKNMVNGVNVLTQRMMSCPNTVYVITYDYSLRGQEITVPDNCVLEFEGGKIDYGIIVGNNTKIISSDKNVIFGLGITISGNWNITDIYDGWFSFNNSEKFISNDIIKNILALGNDNVNNTIHFEADRTYYFELPYKGRANLGDDVRPDYWKLNTEEYAFLRIFTGITSNTHLIFNNTLQMIPTNQGAYYIFHIESKENIQISGVGSINGDAKDHLYTDPFAGQTYYGEWGHIFNIRSCNNIVIKDVTLAYAFGDAIGLGNVGLNVDGNKGCLAATKNVTIDGVKVLYARRNGISLGGNNYSISNVYFEGCGSEAIRGIAPKAAIDFENDYTEIDPSGVCTNVVMSNCKFKDNAYDVSSTIRWDLGEVPTGQLVTINGCNFTAPLRLNKSRGLTFNDCHIVGISSHDNSISPWTVSEEWIFNNCNFDELNPYLVVSASDYKHQFNNCTYPENIQCQKIFRGTMAKTRAIKFSIPKPISVGELELVAICSNTSYNITWLPINITKYTIGTTNVMDIRDIKIEARTDSYPRFSMYKQTPVFSYINYNEDPDNINIYFTLGGNLAGDALENSTEVNVFLNSKTRYIVKEDPVPVEGVTVAGIYGGKWSEISAIKKTIINISDIPADVVFPSKEIYPNSSMEDLNQVTNLKSHRMGKQVYVTDSIYRQPAYWDSISLTWRTADGNRTLERSVTSTEALETLAAKLTESDRGYRVYTSVHSSYLIWDGIQWLNEDGSLYSNVKFINKFFTIERLNAAMSRNNVIYKIVGDIDLGGGELTIVNGCTLDFQGGSISNGTIIGNNTKIRAGIEKIFGDNILINGVWNCSEIYDTWFTKVDDSFVYLQNIFNLTSDNFLGNVHINQNHNIDIPSNAASIKPNSNTIINIKGNITVNPNEFTNYYVFRLIDKSNVIFTGGGSLIGDVETHTGTTGEWGHGIFIQGSNNVTISNLNLTKFWGDGIEVDKSTTNSYSSELYIRNLTISNNRRQGISLLSVKNVFIDNCIIYGIGSINGTNPKGAIDIEPEGDDIAENVFITNCIEYSNGLGITAHNTIKNIIVDNCTCLSSQGIWHTGDITFKNCSFGRYFNLEGDIIRFVNCDMPITNVISSNYVEINGCTFRSKASFDSVSDKIALLVFNYSDAAIAKTCKVRVRNSSFDNTKEGTSSIPLVRKALAKNMGDKDVVFEKCSFKNVLSYLYGAIQYGDYYNCLFEVPTLALQLYADKIIKLVGNTIVKNDTAIDIAIIIIESITKNFDDNSVVLSLMGNSFQYSGVSIIDIIPTNVNDKIVSFINNSFSTRYISEEATLYINLKNKFDNFYFSTSRLDYNQYAGMTNQEGTPSVNNAGQLFYDSTLKKMKLWNGSAWVNLDGTTLS